MAARLTYEQAVECGLADQWPADQKRGGSKLALPELTGKRSKYGAEPTVYKGIRYHSKGEANRARLLDGRKESGEILWWVRQVKLYLGIPEHIVIIDFLVCTKTEGSYYEDWKGFETPEFAKTRRLWLAYGPSHGPSDLHIVTRKGVEIITPIGAQP